MDYCGPGFLVFVFDAMCDIMNGMRIKCDYCGSIIEELNEVCPNCGAALSGVNRFAGEQPRTIEELKAWYIARKR